MSNFRFCLFAGVTLILFQAPVEVFAACNFFLPLIFGSFIKVQGTAKENSFCSTSFFGAATG